MEKIKIVYSTTVLWFLNGLAETLFNEDYFSYIENAQDYAENITLKINNELHQVKQYNTPIQLLKHGKYYAKFLVNKRTVWYAFFDKKENNYLIKHITNNHNAIASYLNE